MDVFPRLVGPFIVYRPDWMLDSCRRCRSFPRSRIAKRGTGAGVGGSVGGCVEESDMFAAEASPLLCLVGVGPSFVSWRKGATGGRLYMPGLPPLTKLRRPVHVGGLAITCRARPSTPTCPIHQGRCTLADFSGNRGWTEARECCAYECKIDRFGT